MTALKVWNASPWCDVLNRGDGLLEGWTFVRATQVWGSELQCINAVCEIVPQWMCYQRALEPGSYSNRGAICSGDVFLALSGRTLN